MLVALLELFFAPGIWKLGQQRFISLVKLRIRLLKLRACLRVHGRLRLRTKEARLAWSKDSQHVAHFGPDRRGRNDHCLFSQRLRLQRDRAAAGSRLRRPCKTVTIVFDAEHKVSIQLGISAGVLEPISFPI